MLSHAPSNPRFTSIDTVITAITHSGILWPPRRVGGSAMPRPSVVVVVDGSAVDVVVSTTAVAGGGSVSGLAAKVPLPPELLPPELLPPELPPPELPGAARTGAAVAGGGAGATGAAVVAAAVGGGAVGNIGGGGGAGAVTVVATACAPATVGIDVDEVTDVDEVAVGVDAALAVPGMMSSDDTPTSNTPVRVKAHLDDNRLTALTHRAPENLPMLPEGSGASIRKHRSS